MYIIDHFQLNRGTFNAQAAGGALQTTIHTYKSADDTLAAILVPGYFPTNFGFPTADVQVGDMIGIVGSDNAFTLGLITNTSIVAINTSSDDSFPLGIKVNLIEGLTPAAQMFIGNNQTSTITVGGALANVLFPGGVITDFIFNGSALATLSIGQNAGGAAQILIGGTPTITRVSNLNPLSDSGVPLKISANSNVATEIGKVGVATQLVGGWRIGTGPFDGQVQTFEETTVNFTWGGPWAAPQQAHMRIKKFDQQVYLSLHPIDPAVATIGGQTINSIGIIPVPFRPLVPITTPVGITDNAVGAAGMLTILPTGSINYTTGYNGGLFSGVGLTGATSAFASYDVTIT